MQAQQEREEKTVTIASAVALFALVAAAGSLVLGAIDYAVELNDSTMSTLWWVVVAGAGTLTVTYLARNHPR